MPTAQDVYEDILNFLARGTSPSLETGLQNPAEASAVAGTPNNAFRDCDDPAPFSLRATAHQLLPLTTAGKGELSVHFELHAHLRSKGYCVLSEVPPDPKTAPANEDTRNRDRLDMVVFDSYVETPIAVIELKHHSVHQSASTTLLKAIKIDYEKRSKQTFAKLSIGSSIPLVQVGLLTAISSPAWVSHHSNPFTPNFIRTYVAPPLATKKETATSDAMSVAPTPASLRRWQVFPADVAKRCKSHGWPYRQVAFGPGPREQYFHSPSGVTIDGYVGYVCVMT